MYRSITPIQQFDSTACWAASFAWWTRAMPSRTNVTQGQMLSRYSHLCNNDESSPDYGTLSLHNLQTLFGQSCWRMNRRNISIRGDTLTRLQEYMENGPFVLGYHQLSVGNHVVVAFETHGSPDRISVMDPNGAAFRDLRLSALSRTLRIGCPR